MDIPIRLRRMACGVLAASMPWMGGYAPATLFAGQPGERPAGHDGRLVESPIPPGRQPVEALAARAGQPVEPPAWSLPRGAVQTVIAQQAALYGAPADIVYYEAPLGVSGMLAHFQQHHPELRDLTVLQGMAVLSDRQGPCLRTATVTGVGSARSAGTLSRVCWPEAAAQAGQAPRWLPAGARLAFDFATREPAGRHVQQVWRHPDAPGVVRAALRRNLLQSGWIAAPEDAPGPRQWVRAAQALDVDVVAAGTGSAIVIGLQAYETASAAAQGLESLP
ncbi:hypothetical protein [Bordetella genomosp. 13]|uniref:hypothetical protein n=1 Tax=Bordetella genomosp. 13 TaxID=463040 RepID=UPI0016426C96|nr:hypothetical protein [Bordetella genomosp. 13]